MSHDTEAAFAASQVARSLSNKEWSVYAGREGNRTWPLADGVIFAENARNNTNLCLALEYKRPNEGVHGVLTALGQSIAYLDKGYHASIVVIPEEYSTLHDPGQYLSNVISNHDFNPRIGIYVYSAPDYSAISPFDNKLKCINKFALAEVDKKLKSRGDSLPVDIKQSTASTLWAHMREGTSFPDAFFRYCQSLKLVSTNSTLDYGKFPKGLECAIMDIDPTCDIRDYLSYVHCDTIPDKAWKDTWLQYYFWEDVRDIWDTSAPYTINATRARILRSPKKGDWQALWTGKAKTSIKPRLVKELNAGAKSEHEAWREFAKAIRNNAHSYREVIDSGLFHVGFVSSDGLLTDLGYKFVEACERFGSAYSAVPFEILRGALLQNGNYAAMLHYIYKISEDVFSKDFMKFSTENDNGTWDFDSDAYLAHIYNYFVNELHLIKTSSARNSKNCRKLFQAELRFLKLYGLVKMKNARSISYRPGTGIVINWEQVQNSLLAFAKYM